LFTSSHGLGSGTNFLSVVQIVSTGNSEERYPLTKLRILPLQPSSSLVYFWEAEIGRAVPNVSFRFFNQLTWIPLSINHHFSSLKAQKGKKPDPQWIAHLDGWEYTLLDQSTRN
jgi:hypothetical protein